MVPMWFYYGIQSMESRGTGFTARSSLIFPTPSWSKIGETVNTLFRDPGAAGNPVYRFYSVVGFNPGGEGVW